MTTLLFDEERHIYTVNGERVVSVTQAIQGLVDFSMVPPWMLEWKAALGKAVHKATELFDLDDLEPLGDDDPAIGYVRAWARFRDETGFVPTQLEQRLYHPIFEYCGTLDRVGYMTKTRRPNVLGIYEIKTTASLPVEYTKAQTAGYFKAYNLTALEQARERFAVHLRGDGTYQLHQFDDIATDFAAFLGHLERYQEAAA
jgi:hypothetical protein